VWRQADTAAIARFFYLNGYNIFYPQVYWGGAGPGYVDSEFQLYTFIVALLYGLGGEQLWLGRLVSIAFSVGTSVAFYSIAKRLLKREIALWALAFFVFSPINIRFGVAFMPEAAMFFFFVLGFAAFLKWSEEEHRHSALVMTASFAVASLLKPTALIAGPIVVLVLVRRRGWLVLRDVRLWFIAAGVLVPTILWYAHARDLFLEYGNTFGIISGGDIKFGGPQYWFSPSFYYNLLRLESIWVFAGFTLPFAAIGIVRSLRIKRSDIVWIGWLFMLLSFMITARYARADWGINYHLPALPFAALSFAVGAEWLFSKMRERWQRPAAIILAMGIFAMTAGTWYLMLRPASNRVGEELVRCGETVQRLVPEGGLIIVSTESRTVQDGVENNFQEPTIFFYARRSGWSLPADRHAPEAVEELRRKGATHLVLHRRHLFDAHPELIQYLQTQSDQIGPGIDSGCAIYRFRVP